MHTYEKEYFVGVKYHLPPSHHSGQAWSLRHFILEAYEVHALPPPLNLVAGVRKLLRKPMSNASISSSGAFLLIR